VSGTAATNSFNGKPKATASEGKPKATASEGKPKATASEGKPETASDGKPRFNQCHAVAFGLPLNEDARTVRASYDRRL
jgi:hypothetical protein